jgi:energy-coupling factor transporter ATP-binding protein EcfA2
MRPVQLTRHQLNQIIEILLPHVNTSEEDRRALIQRAFYGEPVVEQLTYDGQAVTFAMNCILHLKTYNTEASIAQLLKTLKEFYVGAERAKEIDNILSEISPTAAEVEIPSPVSVSDTQDLPELTSHLFISYSRRNLDFVSRLRGDLQRHGIPYWLDKEGLSPGTPNWERAIRAAIHDSSAILWIVSPASYESEFVNSELAVAEMYKRKIYPVWADGGNWVACVPLGKHNIQFVDLRGENYVTGLKQLLAALGKVESELAVPQEETPEAPTEPRNPYKGLMAFMEADTGDFFGREALVTFLAHRFEMQLAAGEDRFLAVLGPSGAGKSSVVMAGLIPALQRGAITGSQNWKYSPRMVPGVHPMENLAATLSHLIPAKDTQELLKQLYITGLEDIIEYVVAEYIVLYVDQFEELFTLTTDDAERQQFISLLTQAATEPDGRFMVFLSMRADFLDYPLNYPQLGTLFNRYNELVQPMQIHELRDAIVKPARLPDVGLTFDDGLVADIVFALRGRDKALAGALPLLQFTLERLYAERDGARLTREAYERMGGLSGAIGTHSETVFGSLDEATQEKFGQVFLQLVSVDRNSGEATRRRVSLDKVLVDKESKKLAHALIQNRLLQTGYESGQPYLEITHEALLHSWDRLRSWVMEVREDLLVLRRMRDAVQEWELHGRPGYLLWRHEQLQRVYKMRERLGVTFTQSEALFCRPESGRLLDEFVALYEGDTRTGMAFQLNIVKRFDEMGVDAIVPMLDALRYCAGSSITRELTKTLVKYSTEEIIKQINVTGTTSSENTSISILNRQREYVEQERKHLEELRRREEAEKQKRAEEAEKKRKLIEEKQRQREEENRELLLVTRYLASPALKDYGQLKEYIAEAVKVDPPNHTRIITLWATLHLRTPTTRILKSLNNPSVLAVCKHTLRYPHKKTRLEAIKVIRHHLGNDENVENHLEIPDLVYWYLSLEDIKPLSQIREQAIPELIAALNHESENHRRQAIEAIVMLNATEAISELQKMEKKERYGSVKKRVLSALDKLQ